MTEEIKTRLELIAAKAKTMANDLQRYWEGDLEANAAELTQECHKLNAAIQNRRRR